MIERQTDPRIKWIPYYDGMRGLTVWSPTEWAKWSGSPRDGAKRFAKDEPVEVPGKTEVHWNEYDKLRARLAPDPRRDWIIV